MPQNVETYLRNLHTSDNVRADAWDALNSDDPKVVEERLRNVRGLTDNLKAKLWDIKFPAAAPTAEPAAPADPYDANALTKVVGAGRSVLGGIGQGVASTVLHIDDAARALAQRYVQPDAEGNVRRIPRPLHDSPNVQAAITPYNTASAVGKGAEQIAEFALPGGAVGKLTKASSLATRAGAQAATAGVVAAAQEGDVSAATVPAIIAGATPVVGAGMRKGAEQLVKRVLPLSVVEKIQTTMPRLSMPANAPKEAQELAEALGSAKPPQMTPGNTQALKELYEKQQRAVESILRNRLLGNADDVARIERNTPRVQGDVLDIAQMRNSMDRVLGVPQALSEALAANRTEPTMSALAAGLGYLLGNVPGGLIAGGAMHAGQRYPLQSAHVLNWLAQQLLRPSAAGITSGVGASADSTSELEAELLRRQTEGR